MQYLFYFLYYFNFYIPDLNHLIQFYLHNLLGQTNDNRSVLNYRCRSSIFVCTFFLMTCEYLQTAYAHSVFQFSGVVLLS